MTSTIERSTGTYTGYMGYFCGNGYKGLTKELDDTVKREAELLAKAFNRDVEIRFNSDRNSGGAFLKNSLKGFFGNCQVGFTAGLRPIKPDNMSREDWILNTTSEFIESQPKVLYIETYVSASCLKDPKLAKDGTRVDKRCSIYHNSIEDGLAWLIANIDITKIYD